MKLDPKTKQAITEISYNLENLLDLEVFGITLLKHRAYHMPYSMRKRLLKRVYKSLYKSIKQMT